MFGKKKKEEKSMAKIEKSSKKELTKEQLTEKLEEGALRVMVTFEVVGKPESFVENSLTEYLKNVRKDSRIHVLNEVREDPEKQEEGDLFSTFAEVEMLVDNLSVLVWLAVNFSPASVEIMEPAEHVMQAADVTSWLNDLISKLHEVSFAHRDALQKNIKLNESLNALIKNSILTALETGNHDDKTIGKKIGIHHEQLEPFLQNLVENGKVSKAGETYALKK